MQQILRLCTINEQVANHVYRADQLSALPGFVQENYGLIFHLEVSA
jgi:hypothetical protein